MAELIKMPKMSDTMEDGVIAKWLKKTGDKVSSGDIIAEIETDKATLELEAFEGGTLLYLAADERSSVPVGEVIAIIGEAGENIDELIKNIHVQQPEAKTLETDHISDHVKEEKTPVEKPVDTSDIPASVVTMPKMSDTMTEGTIAAWHKNIGDEVKTGDILAEIETDKATMELESYEDGYLLYKGVEEGRSVPVDGIIAVVGEKGADYKKLLQMYSGGAELKEQPAEKPAAQGPAGKSKAETGSHSIAEKEVAQETTKRTGERIKASPLAKKMASDHGYDISMIKGSGENGRIVKRDVENYSPGKAMQSSSLSGMQTHATVGEEAYEDLPLSQMRKTIARRLSESKFSSPHFYLTMEINMDKSVDARESMNEVSPVKLSYNDMIIKAVATALRLHPDVNVSWFGDKIRRYSHIHIGVAVAVEEGLVVPVIRFADNKPISVISAEVKQLSEKARNRQLQPQDWEGNTFTISNLGMFGIEEFTAIINPPDACILAIGGIKETPVVKGGEIVPGHVMKVTMSCDHRAVDGATGAAFLKTLKSLLEDPVRLLI